MNAWEDWFADISERICQTQSSLEAFYSHFFAVSTFKRSGNSIKANPCPFCGHNDCFNLTVGVAAAQCFSCSDSMPSRGTHIQLVCNQRGGSKEGVFREIGRYFNLPYPERDLTPEQKAEHTKRERIQAIRRIAVEHYVDVFWRSSAHVEHQLEVRKHKAETLRLMQVGLGGEWPVLKRQLLAQKYTEDEIKAAKVWFHEGLVIYPYYSLGAREIVRFNTKNPLKVRDQIRDSPTFDQIIEGFSREDKAVLFSPRVRFDSVVLVEGENDLLTLLEQGEQSVAATGGTLTDGEMQSLERFKAFYLCFDDDEKGRKYAEQINRYFCDRPVQTITWRGDEFKDIDEYYRKADTPLPWLKLKEAGVPLKTDECRIVRDGHTFAVINRERKLEFTVEGKNKDGTPIGTMNYYKGDLLDDRQEAYQLSKFKKAKPYNFYLSDHIETFFNEDLDNRAFAELLFVYPFTKTPQYVINLLARRIYDDQGRIEQYSGEIRRTVGQRVMEEVLKTVNDLNARNIQNTYLEPIRLGQHFDPIRGNAYYFFGWVREEEGVMRSIPYLISNQRKLIRLDLYRANDPQQILVLDGIYRLPGEVLKVEEPESICLDRVWVERWMDDTVTEQSVDPLTLVVEIEQLIRRFYYFNNEDFFRIMALWIYGTYYYELFDAYPYLHVHGPKGTGKTTLDKIINRTAFNPLHFAQVSEAAVYRQYKMHGCTMILDEFEMMTTRMKSAESVMAAILKSGYDRNGGQVGRFDKENNETERFNVYGPKVISNILGLEDVLADRCLTIQTVTASASDTGQLERFEKWVRRNTMYLRELTSRCAISALTHFVRLYAIDEAGVAKMREVTNLRLGQIMEPIAALAELVGGGYPDALARYYRDTVQPAKKTIEAKTPEWAVVEVVRQIAREILRQTDSFFTNAVKHSYKQAIAVDNDIQGKYFVINEVHFKLFVEQYVKDVDLKFGEIDTLVLQNLGRYLAGREEPYRYRKYTGWEDVRDLYEQTNRWGIQAYHYQFYLDRLKPLLEQQRLRTPIELASDAVKPKGNDPF